MRSRVALISVLLEAARPPVRMASKSFCFGLVRTASQSMDPFPTPEPATPYTLTRLSSAAAAFSVVVAAERRVRRRASWTAGTSPHPARVREGGGTALGGILSPWYLIRIS